MVIEAGLPTEAVLDCPGEMVMVRADAPIWVDIEELRRCWRIARNADAGTLTTEAAEMLSAGIMLYRGSFLPDHYEEWC